MRYRSLWFILTLGLLAATTGSYIITPSYSQLNVTEPRNQESVVKANLVRFDKLDFDAFSNQNWTLFNEIHTPDVKVIWPDGRQTTGIEQHDKDVKAFFAYAPDTKIKVHPIKFGSGNWTAATGIMIGTFSKPMSLANGSIIQPTGKPFNVTLATIAKWNNGRITEEHLFWDNNAFMKQIGLNK